MTGGLVEGVVRGAQGEAVASAEPFQVARLIVKRVAHSQAAGIDTPEIAAGCPIKASPRGGGSPSPTGGAFGVVGVAGGALQGIGHGGHLPVVVVAVAQGDPRHVGGGGGDVASPVQGVVQGEAFGSGGLPKKVEEGVVGELQTISDHLLPTHSLNVRKIFDTTVTNYAHFSFAPLDPSFTSLKPTPLKSGIAALLYEHRNALLSFEKSPPRITRHPLSFHFGPFGLYLSPFL